MENRKPHAALQVRLPLDLKKWLESEAAANGSSQNSEIIRAIRDRKDRLEAPAN